MNKLIFTFSFLCALNPIFSQTPGNGVTDAQGNTYSTVIIGNQEWMAENLKTLPAVTGSNDNSSTIPKYYVYDYQFTDVNEARQTPNYNTYGVLYNWPAVMNGSQSSNSVPSGVQGVCPSGWNVPSDADWKVLENHIGMCQGAVQGCVDSYGERGTNQGSILKSTTGWNNGNSPSNNSTGFNALPGGHNEGWTAFFWTLGGRANFWTSTELSSNYAVQRSLSDVNSTILRQDIGGVESTKATGKSVRCVRSACQTTSPTGSTIQTFCNSTTLADINVNGNTIQWYNSQSGGSLLENTTILQNNATYYASQTVNGCESTDRLAVTVTILAPSSPLGTSSQTFCNAATVNNLSATGTSIQWYNAASGGTALSASTALVNGQNYYASQTENNCESQQRLVVSVTINSPTAPTGLATQNFCNSATVGDLSATGINVQWFNTSTGGTPLATSTVLGNGNYFASQTINNCESANRLTVTVSVFSNPNTNVTLNGNTLTASQQGASYQWLNCDNNLSPISGANQMSYSPLVSGNYAVSITINGCTSTSNCTYVQVLTGSIDENEDSFIINLYPNPNSGTFTFETKLTGKYLVINNLGQIIAEFNVEYPSQKEVNLDKPSKGVYYIKHNENQTRPTKLIVH